jgi:hypothetical protein
VELIAMFLDGIEFAEEMVIVALGVTTDGTKVPLGLWSGSTENHVVAGALVPEPHRARAARRSADALRHRRRQGHPTRRCARSSATAPSSSDAKSTSCATSATTCPMRAVHTSSSRCATPTGARAHRSPRRSSCSSRRGWTPTVTTALLGSVREGLDETLTVLRLGLPPTLCRTFSTTNAIENMNGTLRRICRNVKRWRGAKMIKRWIALGIAEAQKRFRRVKGHAQLPVLVAALRPTTTEAITLEKKTNAA